MRERLGSYVLASPLDDASVIVTRNATSVGAGGRPRKLRLDVLSVEDGLTDALAARFEEDAQAAASLEHESVVRLIDHGVDGGFAYVVYEPYVFQTVADVLSGSGRLEPELAAALAGDVASGLAAAHALRPTLVHRGVDPTRVRVDPSGRAVLHGHALVGLAHGLVRARGAAWDRPHYLSPEILQDGQVTAASDLFSLGSTLYELLMGRRAFDGSSPSAAAMKIRSGSYEALDALPSTLPVDLRRLLRELLEKDASRRPRADVARRELSSLGESASEQRKKLGAIVKPAERKRQLPSVNTKPAVSSPAQPVTAPSLKLQAESAPTSRDPLQGIPPPVLPARPGPTWVLASEATVDSSLDLSEPAPTASAEPFSVAEPTMLEQALPEPRRATSALDGPTVADPESLAAAFGIATAEIAPPGHDEVATNHTIPLPMGPTGAGDVAPPPTETPALPPTTRLPQKARRESGVPVVATIALAGLGAVLVVTLGVLLTLWIASAF